MTATPLPQVTVVIVDTLNYGEAINAIQKTLKQVTPARTMFFTDIELEIPGVDVIQIHKIRSKKEYSEWMIKKLGTYEINTPHVLIIQNDGYVLDGTQWDEEFLKYDYAGAVWPETDGYNVGNGGFSLRTWRLHQILAQDDLIEGLHPEDSTICRIYRDYLERTHGITFMPVDLAHKFSFELCQPHDKTFGFHAKHHPPYVEPVVIKRSGALGDVIQVEPVLEYFHKQGHPVYLDTDTRFHSIFNTHSFPIRHYSSLDRDMVRHRFINLDMAYEVFPDKPHIEAYFRMAGIKDMTKLRGARLYWEITDVNRLFKKYCVIHIDERETTHRNVHGIKWAAIQHELEIRGYTVIQVGRGSHQSVGLYFNTVNEIMLKWLIAGCDLFIGVDSGPSHMAVALQKKSIIFFGSVNPRIIHIDLNNIVPLQSGCPIGKDHCWHQAGGTRGINCEVDESMPPCTVIDTRSVIEAIDNLLIPQ